MVILANQVISVRLYIFTCIYVCVFRCINSLLSFKNVFYCNLLLMLSKIGIGEEIRIYQSIVQLISDAACCRELIIDPLRSISSFRSVDRFIYDLALRTQIMHFVQSDTQKRYNKYTTKSNMS